MLCSLRLVYGYICGVMHRYNVLFENRHARAALSEALEDVYATIRLGRIGQGS